MKYDYEKLQGFESVYNVVKPFDVWKSENRWRKWLPSFLFGDAESAVHYLAEAEAVAGKRGARCFGFKVLTYHLEERPFLGPLLKKRGHLAIYLTRHLARQVLSGMVANERGVFGVRKGFEDSRRYHIDVDKFERIVEWNKDGITKDRAWLEANGFPFIDITYEDFLFDRQSLYDKIFGFLEVPSELPPPSDWGIAIRDLRYTIENYDAVAERAAAIGVPLE